MASTHILFCLAHQVELIVKKVVQIDPVFVNVLASAKKIVKHVDNHAIVLAAFETFSQSLYQGFVWELVLPGLTRWIGWYYCVSRLARCRAALIVTYRTKREYFIKHVGQDQTVESIDVICQTVADQNFWDRIIE